MSYTLESIHDEYFEWLSSLVCKNQFSKQFSYGTLLRHLHDTEFIYSIPKDQNRAEDGLDLRYRFAMSCFYGSSHEAILEELDGPCSVLEMMVALSIRCEENIMDDPNIGDRTRQWFWGMIANLGLNSMYDARYDRRFVDDRLMIFLNRAYEPDGKGGLFRIRDCDRDLRTVEIWYQLCWYLDSIT